MNSACLSDSWIRKQLQLRHDLSSARSSPDPTRLRQLVDSALALYDSHYRARSERSNSDPLSVFAPPSSTPLERAAHWMSGWRPNILVHLLYTESGLRFEAQLQNLFIGSRSEDIGDITPAQLVSVDEIQRRTIQSEIEIDDELREAQAGAWDPFPPADSDLDLRLERVGRAVVRADELRMRTLRSMVGILEPLQAVDLLVAAADLEVGINGLGVELNQRLIQLEGRVIRRGELVFKKDKQEYAQVLCMLGNGRCEYLCIYGTKRLCHIHDKIHKKVWIAAGDIVLVGLRNYQDDKASVILKYMYDEARLLKAYGELSENTRLNEGVANGMDEDDEGVADDYVEFGEDEVDKI